MARITLGASAVLATSMGIMGALFFYGEGAFTIGTILVVATFGSISIHAVLSPESYGSPRFDSAFYRVWTAVVPLLGIAALLTAASSPVVAGGIVYWSGFAATAVLAGAVVGRRSTRATASDR